MVIQFICVNISDEKSRNKKGDEIITPCLNFGTAVSAIIDSGATPIFVDIEIDTLQQILVKLKEKLQKNKRL